MVQGAFGNSLRSWTDPVDLVKVLAQVLGIAGHSVKTFRHWVALKNGFTLVPQVVSFQSRADRGVLTTSTIQIAHASLVPAGVFEYQHSTGPDLTSSFAKGFEGFTEFDLPVFLDALRPEPEQLPVFAMSFPSYMDADGPLQRRAVLGPPAHFLGSGSTGVEAEDHAFCPCCLLMNSLAAFSQHFESPEFYAIRLFAMRDADGTAQADCRVNGDDWPPGQEALLRYVDTWPQRGVEFRKQHVCIQKMPLPQAPKVAKPAWAAGRYEFRQRMRRIRPNGGGTDRWRG